MAGVWNQAAIAAAAARRLFARSTVTYWTKGERKVGRGTIGGVRALKNTRADGTMNQVLQQGTRPAIVSLSANAISKARGRGDEERLVCIAEETPVAFRYNGFS